MKRLVLLSLILCTCTTTEIKESDCGCNYQVMLDACLSSITEMKYHYNKKGELTVHLGNIPNIEYSKYKYVLRSYGEDLEPFRVANGFDDYDYLVANCDSFGIIAHCYQQFTDRLIFKKYGENFYEEVEERVKNDFKGMTEAEIRAMYHRDFPPKNLK